MNDLRSALAKTSTDALKIQELSIRKDMKEMIHQQFAESARTTVVNTKFDEMQRKIDLLSDYVNKMQTQSEEFMLKGKRESQKVLLNIDSLSKRISARVLNVDRRNSQLETESQNGIKLIQIE